MKRVYQAANLQEAYLLAGLLAGEGIETRIFNENAQGALGEIPFPQAYPELWVANDAQARRAAELIEAWERQGPSGESRACPRCGEVNPKTFELCWVCGRPLDT